MFEISDTNIKLIKAWKESKNLKQYTGAIGGRFTYFYTPKIDTNQTEIMVEDGIDSTHITFTENGIFSVCKEYQEKLDQWLNKSVQPNKHNRHDITYITTSTSLGDIMKAKNNVDNNILVLTDFSDW